MRKIIFLAALLIAVPGWGAILPGAIGQWKQVSSSPLDVQTNRPLWDEYGLQEAAESVYRGPAGTLAVQAWRLADSTSSMAAFEYLRPAGAKPAPAFDSLTPNAALLPDGGLVALGNYLVRFQGALPEPEAVADMFRSMAHYERSALPTFNTYLPSRQIPNTERYIGGPVSLQQFFPEVQPAVAGFRLGAEAAVAEYQPSLKLALFSYPTPSIARDREAALTKIPGAVVKRTGPLVAVIAHPADPNAAEKLLSQIRYQATVTTGERAPNKKDNPGNLLLNVFYLILIVGGFCLVSGVVFGLGRMVFRRSGPAGDGEEILALHLEGR